MALTSSVQQVCFVSNVGPALSAEIRRLTTRSNSSMVYLGVP